MEVGRNDEQIDEERENSSSDISWSDTTLFATHSNPVSFDNGTDGASIELLSCASQFLEILAAILTSGRLSSRILFSIFWLSRSACFNVLASRFILLRDSLSDGVNGVRLC